VPRTGRRGHDRGMRLTRATVVAAAVAVLLSGCTDAPAPSGAGSADEPRPATGLTPPAPAPSPSPPSPSPTPTADRGDDGPREVSPADRGTAEAAEARIRPALERLRDSGRFAPGDTRDALLALGFPGDRVEVQPLDPGARPAQPPGAVFAVLVGDTACVTGRVVPDDTYVDVSDRPTAAGCLAPVSP